MALRKALVVNGGQIQQLQSGDTLDVQADVVGVQNDNASPAPIGTPLYTKAGGTQDFARANASGTSIVTGLVIDASISSGGTGYVKVSGVMSATTGQWDAVTGGSGGLTPGSIYYLDPSTAGKLTSTAPSTTGQFVCEVGEAISTTDFVIRINKIVGL